LKLFWSTRSPFVRLVMVIAHEKGLVAQIECEQVVVAASRPNEDVMAHNPLNKLPTLVLDDGTALYDSRVIAEYFDATGNGPALFPMAGEARWDALRRAALGFGLLDLLVGWLPERRKAESERDSELGAALELKFRAAIDELERIAGDMAGNEFDIGQAAIGCALGYADFRYGDLDWRQGHPVLSELCDDIAGRPSFRATAHADVY